MRLPKKLISITSIPLLLTMSPLAQAAQSLNVPSNSNLFYAGTNDSFPLNTTGPNENIPVGDGQKAPYLVLPPGIRSLQIQNSNNQGIGFGGPYVPVPGRSTPDGTYVTDSGITNSYSRMLKAGTNEYVTPGLSFSNRFGMLAAIFWDSQLLDISEVEFSPIDSLSNRFVSGATAVPTGQFDMNAQDVTLPVRSPFFIGDGTVIDFVDRNWPTNKPAVMPDGTEQRQTIVVPNNAIRLYFGFADAFAINGFNNFYGDNVGSVNVKLMQTISDDVGSVEQGQSAIAIASVVTNDTIDGAIPDLSTPNSPSMQGTKASVTAVDSTDEGATAWANGDGITLEPSTGAVSIAASTPAGEYKKWYRLCDNTTTNFTNNILTTRISAPSCSDALITVNVTNTPVVKVEGVPDSKTIQGPITEDTLAIENVRKNDLIGGADADENNSTIAQTGIWTGFSLNTDPGSNSGAVTIERNAVGRYPIPGTYPLSYSLCEAGSTSNCVAVPIDITITDGSTPIPHILANGYAYPQTIYVGQTTTLNPPVVFNDFYNEQPAVLGTTPGAVSLSLPPGESFPVGSTFDSKGSIVLDGTTPAGVHLILYQICAISAPQICDSARVRFVIKEPLAAAVPVPTTKFWTLLLLSALIMRTHKKHRACAKRKELKHPLNRLTSKFTRTP